MSINLVSRRKLKGIEPDKVRRTGPFGLVRRYEYNLHSNIVMSRIARLNPDVPIKMGGISGGGV